MFDEEWQNTNILRIGFAKMQRSKGVEILKEELSFVGGEIEWQPIGITKNYVSLISAGRFCGNAKPGFAIVRKIVCNDPVS